MIYYMYNHKADETAHKIPKSAIEGEKIKHFYPLIHYCEHCHTDIVGVWEFYGGKSKYYIGDSMVDFDQAEKIDFIQYGFLTGQVFYSRQECEQFARKKLHIGDSYWEYRNDKYAKEGREKKAAEVMGKLPLLLPLLSIIKEYRREYLSFADMERCPICGEKFSDDFRHHLSTVDYSVGYYNLKEKFGFLPSDCARSIYPGNDSWKMYRFTNTKTDDKWNEKTSLFEGIACAEYNLLGKLHGANVQSCEKRWYSKVRYDDSSIESLLVFFRALREEEREEYSNTKIENNIAQYDVSVQAKQDRTNIRSDVDALKIYLSNLIGLEKNIYSVSERLKELYRIEFDANGEAIASAHMLTLSIPTPEPLLEEYNRMMRYNPRENIRVSDFALKEALSKPVRPKEPILPNAPVLETPGLFNKKKVMAKNDALIVEYQKQCRAYEEEHSKYKQELSEYSEAVEKYQKDLERLKKDREAEYLVACEKATQEHAESCARAKAEYEKALEEYNSSKQFAKDIVTPEKAKQMLIKQEIAQAEELLAKLYAARNELYAYNVVFGKYRDIVALSTFYEYLMAGRCETLEGTAGAYNLYEAEIRMNTVISQLAEVIVSLEQIKQSQYVIYTALKEVHSSLNNLNYSMSSAVNSLEKIEKTTTDMNQYLSEISDNTKVIAYNTEATAFYAKKNAELTDALGFMVALG